MKDYQEITTQAEMDELLDLAGGFHDSLVKEFHVVNRGYVQPDGGMVCSFRLDGRLLIQSQCKPYALELLFEGITSLEVSDPGEYYGATGSVIVNRLTEQRSVAMAFDASLRIAASKLYYRERHGWLGNRAFFGAEIPSSDTVGAVEVEPGWWQCSKCANVWREELEVEFSRCPGCGAVTEMQGEG